MIAGSIVRAMRSKSFGLLAVVVASVVSVGSTAMAQSAPEAPAPGVRLGGHLGVALPIVTLGDPVSVLGRDHGLLGVTPGVSLKLDARWTIDFEFIALNDFRNGGATTFVVDPGVLYNFGPVVAGLRVATQVGAPVNFGLVPILVAPFRISNAVSYFVELDLPIFVRDSTDGLNHNLRPSATVQLQTGFAF